MLSYVKEKFNVKSKVVCLVKNPKWRFRFTAGLSNGDPASPIRKSHPLTRRAVKEKVKVAAATILEGVAAMPPIDQNSAANSHAISIPPLEQISTGNVSRGKINIGRIFVAINFLIEIPSAIFDQISSKHKPKYALVVMLLSFTATLLTIIELAYKAGKKRVVWRWEKSKLPWFYHPSPTNKRFGTFPEIVGLVCAISQSIQSAIIYGLYLHHADYPVKISYWPLIFSFGLLCSKLMENQDHNDIFQVSRRIPNVRKHHTSTFSP